MVLSNGVSAQATISADCSNIYIVDEGGNYDRDTYFYLSGQGCAFYKSTPCGIIEWTSCNPALRQFTLQRKEGNNWVDVLTQEYPYPFKGLAHATYRVKTITPIATVVYSCVDNGGFRTVYSYDGRIVGRVGYWGPAQYSNEVIVGATTQDDLRWDFLAHGTNNGNYYYPNTDIIMNVTGTKNYDRWFLAVFEQGGQRRYWSNGWTPGQIANDRLNISTSGIFNNDVLATFPVGYYVQFAIATSCNSGWTNLDRTFLICSSGTVGCRETVQEVKIAPNPATTSFQLLNIDLNTADQIKVDITDMSGRIIKSFGQITQLDFDITDVSNGLYVVNVWYGGRKLLSSKLSVVK
jgi:hypothetical protein